MKKNAKNWKSLIAKMERATSKLFLLKEITDWLFTEELKGANNVALVSCNYIEIL
jgi:hypothetical protein